MLANPYRGKGLQIRDLDDIPWPSASAEVPKALLGFCPVARETPLLQAPELAKVASVSEILVKDERTRMGLGSFKALGAAYAIAREVPEGLRDRPAEALKGRVFVAASAGNHGLSVAAGARVFGAQAIIFLADTVPEAFAEKLRGIGAEVRRAGAIYEESMEAAKMAAAENDWSLLSDSTWEGYVDPAVAVMEGYTVLADEVVRHLSTPPTHILLQAGVGGLATALAACFRAAWADNPRIIVVEPEAAPALHHSIREGRVMDTSGPESTMGRLDCKTPSLVALKGLSRDADSFVLIDDAAVERAMPVFAEAGFATSPSGGAGLAAVMAGLCDLPRDARVLVILSEGPV